MASAFQRFSDYDEEEEGEEEEQDFQSGRECHVFLVDCSGQMFDKVEDTQPALSPFELCARFLRDYVNETCVKSAKEWLSIVFYGTDKKENSLDVEHVYVFQKLGVPGSEVVMNLEKFLTVADLNAHFNKLYGFSDAYSLSDAIWVCAQIFAEVKVKTSVQRVTLLTWNDAPHEGDRKLQANARQKLRDILMHVSLEVVPMAAEFDTRKFYDDFNTDEVEFQISNPVTKVDHLKDLLQRSSTASKRSLSSLKFTLGPGIQLGVNLYALIGKAHKPSARFIYTKTNEPVRSVQTTMLEKTGEKLLDVDIKRFQEYGGRRISLEKDEVDSLKRFGEPELKLVGFKPVSCLKLHHHIRPANFVFPDEKSVKGSNECFVALLKRCLDRRVMAVCQLIARRNMTPRLVVLLPQAEERDEVQVRPAGFHVIYMPFSDDLRRLAFVEPGMSAGSEQVSKAKEVIKSLKCAYDPLYFTNPALEKFYIALESFALNQATTKTLEDKTLPPKQLMSRERPTALLNEFRDLVFPEGYNPGGSGVKRAGGGAAAAAKRVKTEASVSNIDLADYAKNGTLGKLTVAQLKAAATAAGVKLKATLKNDIVNELMKQFA